VLDDGKTKGKANKNDGKKSTVVNVNKCEAHPAKEGQFFCLLDREYLCGDCFEEHKDHKEHTDSVKNLLTVQFNEWRSLMDHAQTVTKARIENNIIKQKDFLVYLKKNSESHPDIDEVTLQLILSNFIKKLQVKINEIKENCKRNDLEGAFAMRSELSTFST